MSENSAARVSIVISVFNGIQYLQQQFDSIRAQSVQPDEVVILDDCSTDGSAQFIEDYISNNRLTTWTLFKNDSNQGWRINFRNLLLNLSSGDYVFPCDQDDIWGNTKLECMLDCMLQNPDADVISCLVRPTYEKGSKHLTKTDVSPSNHSYFNEKVVRVDFSEKFWQVRRPGCSYIIKRSFINSIAPYWDDDFAHDGMIWRFSIIRGNLYVLNKELMLFRRHSNNATDNRRINRTMRTRELEMFIRQSRNLLEFASQNNVGKYEASTVKQFNKWLYARYELISKRTNLLRNVVRMWKYRRFYLSLKSYLTDIYCTIF